MSDTHVYEPRVNGTSFHTSKFGELRIANVCPTHDPMTGQFVPMNGTDEDEFWEDDFENAGGPLDLVHHEDPEGEVDFDHDLVDAPGEEYDEEDDILFNLGYDSGKRPHDNYDMLAARHNISDDDADYEWEELEARMMWRGRNSYFSGIFLEGELMTDSDAQRIGISTWWWNTDTWKIETLPDYELMNLPQYEEDDEFDSLHSMHARRHTMINASKYYFDAFVMRDRRCGDSHRGRKWNWEENTSLLRFDRKAKRLQQHRRHNRDINRVMPTENASRMTAEAYLDDHGEVLDIQEHLDEVNKAIGSAWVDQDEPDHKCFWDTAEGMFTMSEAHQNCHGYSMDPFEEQVLATDDDYLPDDSEAEAAYYEAEAAMEADAQRCRDLMDMEPTQEEWDAIEDLQRAEEADQDQLEQQFEHLPMSNAMGRKAQIAQRALIDA